MSKKEILPRISLAKGEEEVGKVWIKAKSRNEAERISTQQMILD